MFFGISLPISGTIPLHRWDALIFDWIIHVISSEISSLSKITSRCWIWGKKPIGKSLGIENKFSGKSKKRYSWVQFCTPAPWSPAVFPKTLTLQSIRFGVSSRQNKLKGCSFNCPSEMRVRVQVGSPLRLTNPWYSVGKISGFTFGLETPM